MFRNLINFFILLPFLYALPQVSGGTRGEYIFLMSGIVLIFILLIANIFRVYVRLGGYEIKYFPYSSNRFALFCNLKRCKGLKPRLFYLKIQGENRNHYLFLSRRGRKEILKRWEKLHQHENS